MKTYLSLLLLALLSFTSCDDIIEIEDISGRSVNVLAPTEGVVLDITDVIFSWTAVEDAEHYRLQVATPNFENATQIVSDTLITATSFTKTLSAGAYEWRVRAENSGYQTAYTTQNFSIE